MQYSSSSLICAQVILLACASCAFAAPPVLFFLDLESGPNTGGQYDSGAYVTVYGRGFGEVPGYVTVGGGRAASYPVWSDSKITFQLGRLANSGSVVVYASGSLSNALPFIIRSGGIYFVSPNGDDGSNGSFTTPFLTVQRARDAMIPGDITYVRNGINASTNDDWSACLVLGAKSGSPGRPLALVGYPGESPTVGNVAPTSDKGCDSGIRTKGQGEHYWVFAGLRLRGGEEAMSLYGVHDWRIVGNDLSCPQGDGPTACLGTGITSNLKVYGNVIHDAGHAGSSALYHGVYLGTDSNHIDFGWNTIARVQGCRGLQVYASDGSDLFDLQIHDNVIHDTQCDGMILATVDPSKPGGVNVFNNVLYNTGQGPNTPEHSGAFYCINAQGWTNAGTPGNGVIEVYNNTLYNCGSWTSAGYSGANGSITMNGANPAKRLRLRNNIIYQLADTPYLQIDDGRDSTCSQDDNCSRLFGSNNLFWGSGLPPRNANLTNSLYGDPLFVARTTSDFHLQSASPARSAGSATPIGGDLDGNQRPSIPDLGALQFADAAPVSLSCQPGALIGPGTVACTITLPTASATAALTFTIGSDTVGISLPSSVKLAEGSTSIAFAATLQPMAALTQATISVVSGSSRASSLVWLLPPGDTTPVVLSATNAASYLVDGVSPGALITVFGVNLGRQSRATIDATEVPVIGATPGQLTLAAPYGLTPGSIAQLRVTADSKPSNLLTLQVKSTTPATFALNASGKGQAFAFNTDGTINAAGRPARRGSTLTLLVTGLGVTTPVGTVGTIASDPLPVPLAPVTVEIGEVVSPVISVSAAPGLLTGVFQVVVRLASDTPSVSAAPVIIRTPTGTSQQGMTLAIQ